MDTLDVCVRTGDKHIRQPLHSQFALKGLRLFALHLCQLVWKINLTGIWQFSFFEDVVARMTLEACRWYVLLFVVATANPPNKSCGVNDRKNHTLGLIYVTLCSQKRQDGFF